MPTVTQKDREIFRKIGEALNPPIQKVTIQEKLAQMNLEKYLDFLDDAFDLMEELKKGPLLLPPPTGINAGFEKAKKLGLLKNVH